MEVFSLVDMVVYWEIMSHVVIVVPEILWRLTVSHVERKVDMVEHDCGVAAVGVEVIPWHPIVPIIPTVVVVPIPVVLSISSATIPNSAVGGLLVGQLI